MPRVSLYCVLVNHSCICWQSASLSARSRVLASVGARAATIDVEPEDMLVLLLSESFIAPYSARTAFLASNARNLHCCAESADDESLQLELQRLRLQKRADSLTDESLDMSDEDVWVAEQELLKARTDAEYLKKRKAKYASIQNIGGVLWAIAILGVQYSVKEGLVPSEAALATLALSGPILAATGLLGNWRGEDIEWREEQQRRKEEDRIAAKTRSGKDPKMLAEEEDDEPQERLQVPRGRGRRRQTDWGDDDLRDTSITTWKRGGAAPLFVVLLVLYFALAEVAPLLGVSLSFRN